MNNAKCPNTTRRTRTSVRNNWRCNAINLPSYDELGRIETSKQTSLPFPSHQSISGVRVKAQFHRIVLGCEGESHLLFSKMGMETLNEQCQVSEHDKADTDERAKQLEAQCDKLLSYCEELERIEILRKVYRTHLSSDAVPPHPP